MADYAIEVILRNTTSITRWRFSQCSIWLCKLAEQISEEINAAIVFDREPHPWSWFLVPRIKYIDTPRHELVRMAFDTRADVACVASQCYHLMRICNTVKPHPITQAYITCACGDIDVIRRVLADYNISDYNISAAALIYRGYIDEAIGLISTYSLRLTAIPGSDQDVWILLTIVCFAALLCGRESLAVDIVKLVPVGSMYKSACILEDARYLAACMRGDDKLVDEALPGQHMPLSWIICASCISGNVRLITWIINNTKDRCADAIFSQLVRISSRISLEIFEMIIATYPRILPMRVGSYNLPTCHYEIIAKYTTDTSDLVALAPTRTIIDIHKQRGDKLSKYDIKKLLVRDDMVDEAVFNDVTDLFVHEGIGLDAYRMTQPTSAWPDGGY